jgi:hypothetical protein
LACMVQPKEKKRPRRACPVAASVLPLIVALASQDQPRGRREVPILRASAVLEFVQTAPETSCSDTFPKHSSTGASHAASGYCNTCLLTRFLLFHLWPFRSCMSARLGSPATRWLHPELRCTTAAAGHHAVTNSSPAPLSSNLLSTSLTPLLVPSYLRTRNLLRELWGRSTSRHLCASQHTDGVRSISPSSQRPSSGPIAD